MAETATNHHCLDRLNVSLTPQQELMTLYSSENPHLSGECLVNRGADLLNIIVEEIVCQTGYLPQDSCEKRDPLNLPAGEKFRVADFMTSAALASIALRAQPHASEKLRAARFSTHAKTVAAMLPKKRQAEAALALRKIEGAVARLDLPGDQKQAAVDAVKALAKDMPGAPILQRAAVTTMEGASRITDILTEETVRNRIIAAGAVTLTMMTSSLPAAAAEPKGNERDSAVVRVVDDNNPGTPNQQDESTKIQKSVEPAKSIAQMIDTAFKHDTPVKPVNDPTPTPHSDTPRQTVQINPNDGSSNFERVSHEPAVLAALSTELTTAGENALPEPTEPASAQPPTNQTVEPSTIDSRTERDTVQPTTDTPSNDQPSKQNSIEPSAEVDASPLASPRIEEAKGLGRISKIFGMLTKLGSDNNNGEKPDKAEKKDEVAETGAAMAQTLNLNDPKVQEEQRLSLLPEKASRGVLAGSPVAAAFIAGGEGVSSVIDTPPVDAKHLAVSEEELVDAMRNAVETVNSTDSRDERGSKQPSTKEKDAPSEINNKKVRDEAYMDRVEDLRRQSGTPLSAKKLYDLFTEADNRYKHNVIDRDLLLSMAFKESLLGKLWKSNKGAKGMVQFMPGTWKDWGKGKYIGNHEANIDASYRYMIFLYEWTGDRFPQANQTERIKLSLAAYNTGYGRVSRAGGMPKNSSRGYAQWIFTSYNKTRDYIDRAVEEARQKSKSAPNNPIQREYDVSTVDKAKKFLANTPGATMIDGIKKGHDLRSRFGNGNLHNHKGLLKHLNDGNPEHQMMVEAADAWNMMNDAFKKDFGFDLPIRDDAEGRTYRRLSQQKNGSLSAKIGTSRHGDGTAFDAAFHKDAMLSNRLVFARQKKIIKWLRNNAYIYGFVQPEWALLGASSKYEVWHWEFWGEKAVDQQWKNMRWYMDGNRNHNDGYTPDAKMREIFKKAFSD